MELSLIRRLYQTGLDLFFIMLSYAWPLDAILSKSFLITETISSRLRESTSPENPRNYIGEGIHEPNLN
jgi:hypothetical protein